MKFSSIDRDSLILSVLGLLAFIYLVFSGNQVFSVIVVSIVVRLVIGYTEHRLDSIQAKFLSAAFAIVLLVLIVSAIDVSLDRHFVLLNIFSGMSLPSVIVSLFKKSEETRR
jgi:hypothetical protein